MKKIPLVLGLDDPAPLVHVYREHRAKGVILDSGEELVPSIPNSFLYDFCDLVEEYGIKGKFSIVPMPAGKGDIVHGIDGFDRSELDEWLSVVRTRLTPHFDFSPEVLTHWRAADLVNGGFFKENEFYWAEHQTAEALTPYISLALSLLRDVGIIPSGVTVPWGYSENSDAAYAEAICNAFRDTLGIKESWYFSGNAGGKADYHPQVRFNSGDCSTVQVHKTCGDYPWYTMECARTDAEYISELADKYITADGKSGEIVRAVNNNSCAIICTHWQALYSNGRKTGLKVLKETARRVQAILSDRVEWQTFSYLMNEALKAENN